MVNQYSFSVFRQPIVYHNVLRVINKELVINVYFTSTPCSPDSPIEPRSPSAPYNRKKIKQSKSISLTKSILKLRGIFRILDEPTTLLSEERQ